MSPGPLERPTGADFVRYQLAIMSSDMDVVPREDFELICVRSRAESWVQR